MIKSIKPVKYRHTFNDKYSYILCTKYGTNGLIPTVRTVDLACISSSGDSMCGGYEDHEDIPNTNLSIVRCNNCAKECI